jgi:hypothetical protein
MNIICPFAYYNHFPAITGKHSFVKDLVLVVSLVIAVGGCYFAYVQHNRAQSHVQKLMKDLSSLQNAEDTLSEMQQQ